MSKWAQKTENGFSLFLNFINTWESISELRPKYKWFLSRILLVTPYTSPPPKIILPQIIWYFSILLSMVEKQIA